jgi:hypothetical protein
MPAQYVSQRGEQGRRPFLGQCHGVGSDAAIEAVSL